MFNVSPDPCGPTATSLGQGYRELIPFPYPTSFLRIYSIFFQYFLIKYRLQLFFFVLIFLPIVLYSFVFYLVDGFRPDPRIGPNSSTIPVIRSCHCWAFLEPASVWVCLKATFVVGSASVFYHFCSWLLVVGEHSLPLGYGELKHNLFSYTFWLQCSEMQRN